MNIFDKRPLLLILTTLISGFVMFTFSGKILRGLLIGTAVLLICLSLILFFKLAAFVENIIAKNLKNFKRDSDSLWTYQFFVISLC